MITKQKNQQGMVLIVGLVLLTSLTLMGVMAVKMTTLDERIASNNQFRTIAFQGAESILSEISSVNVLTNVAVCDEEFPDEHCHKNAYLTGAKVDEDSAEALLVKAKAVIVDEREVDIPGSSIGESGGAVLKMRVYDIEATAELENTNARALHRAGIGRVIPPSE